MKTPYTYLEVEAIETDYDQQVPLKFIAETVNRDFHNGKQVRSAKSVSYIVNKINNDDEWYKRLEEVWLKELE